MPKITCLCVRKPVAYFASRQRRAYSTIICRLEEKQRALGDGAAVASASFAAPHNLVADRDGNLFVADTYHYAVRRVDAHTGIVTTFAGNGNKELTGDEGTAVALRGSMGLPVCVLTATTPSFSWGASAR
jgi:hypothetical protein